MFTTSNIIICSLGKYRIGQASCLIIIEIDLEKSISVDQRLAIAIRNYVMLLKAIHTHLESRWTNIYMILYENYLNFQNFMSTRYGGGDLFDIKQPKYKFLLNVGEK